MSDCIEVKRLLLKQNALVYKKLITKRDNLLRYGFLVTLIREYISIIG